MPAWFSTNPTAGILTVDIGARVWLDAMRLAVPFVPGYITEVADGSRDPNGRLRWRQVSLPDRMEGGFKRAADLFDPPLDIRFLNLRLPGIARTSGFFYDLTEVLLYTEGFVSQASLVSDIIRLPGPRNFGAIHWDPPPAPTPPARPRKCARAPAIYWYSKFAISTSTATRKPKKNGTS